MTPTGDVVAIPLRGAWCGNRGNLHDDGTSIVRFHKSVLWIVCALEYKDQRLTQWGPGRFTLLFFHDEAVAFAAGHRPCALCRRPAYERYRDAWAAATGGDRPSAVTIDRQLHSERLIRGTHRRRLHQMPWPSLPTGTFVLVDGHPRLVVDDTIVPWATDGYGVPKPRPRAGQVDVLTPPSTVAVLRSGYDVQIDATSLTWPACRTGGLPSPAMADGFPPGFFARLDRSPDAEFYAWPRLVTHIDDDAIAAVGALYEELGVTGRVLDLMGSWISHFRHAPEHLTVLGMNAEELAANAMASATVVHDLNTDPRLPFDDETFDGAVCCASVDYLTSPIAVFADVARVVRSGGPFVCTFSNRCFPTRAVRGWLAATDEQRCAIVAEYFRRSGRWGEPVAHRRTAPDWPGDPLFGVWASRA